MKVMMHVLSACIPSSGCCLTSQIISSLRFHKCFSSVMVVCMASRTCIGIFWSAGVIIISAGLVSLLPQTSF